MTTGQPEWRYEWLNVRINNTAIRSQLIRASKQPQDHQLLRIKNAVPSCSTLPGKHDQSLGEADSSWILRTLRTTISRYNHCKRCCIGRRLIEVGNPCTKRALPKSRPSVKTLPSLAGKCCRVRGEVAQSVEDQMDQTITNRNQRGFDFPAVSVLD